MVEETFGELGSAPAWRCSEHIATMICSIAHRSQRSGSQILVRSCAALTQKRPVVSLNIPS